jgi:hypothetical protein
MWAGDFPWHGSTTGGAAAATGGTGACAPVLGTGAWLEYQAAGTAGLHGLYGGLWVLWGLQAGV